MKLNQAFGSQRQQNGAVLVVALIILLVMSMIGLSNMQSATMQERMAANSRQKTVSQQAAESALRSAEDWLAQEVVSSQSLDQFDGSGGLFAEVIPRPGMVAAPLSSTLDDPLDPDKWSNVGVADDSINSATIKIVAESPRYVIEYLGRDRGTANKEVKEFDYNSKTKDIRPHIFRVTAIGWGRDKNIYSILQTTYRTGTEFTY